MSIDRKSNEYSNQEIIEKLRAIIDLEESKPLAERDVDLITECVDYLMELEQGVELTQEELEEEKQKIYAYNKNLNKPAKRLKFKGLLIAACFVILMLLANLVAIACGVDTIAILEEFGDRIVEMFVGEKTDYKGITIVKGNEFTTYNSLQNFLNNENIAVLFPQKLPEGITISQINVRNSVEDAIQNSHSKEIYFITNAPDTGMEIYPKVSADLDFLTNKHYSQETINNFLCYILCTDISTQCYFLHDDLVYCVTSTSYENIVTIISNLKEIK